MTNPNGLTLIRKTQEPSSSHPYARIWIVECRQGHRLKINGCDFHIRKCPRCEGGAPEES